MKFGERIEAALAHLVWGPKDLERTTNVADSTISALVRRGSDRSNYKDDLIAGFPPEKISHEWLRNESGAMIPSAQNIYQQKNRPDELVIPQFDTGGSMGAGLLLRDQPGVIQSWKVSQEWVQKNVKSHTGAANLCIVTGFGDSMKGMYNSGDPLVVDRGVKSVEFDAVYFFRVGEEGFIKRLQRIPGEGLRVLSENKQYDSWHIRADMDFEVLGRVVKAWQGEDF